MLVSVTFYLFLLASLTEYLLSIVMMNTWLKLRKKHFFAEHLFDDLHQDQPLFRWHPHHSYTDIVFVERMKEIEATNSYDEARTVSGGTTADNVSF